MDPEIPVNIYDLGLIYAIDIDSKNNVLVNITWFGPQFDLLQYSCFFLKKRKSLSVFSCVLSVIKSPPN